MLLQLIGATITIPDNTFATTATTAPPPDTRPVLPDPANPNLSKADLKQALEELYATMAQKERDHQEAVNRLKAELEAKEDQCKLLPVQIWQRVLQNALSFGLACFAVV